MTDVRAFAEVVIVASAVGLVAVLSSRLTARLRIPSPALVLVVAAVVAKLVPALHATPERDVERIVTVALACILFDGGMHIGWPRFKSAAAPIMVLGVAGTFLTTAAAAAVLHLGFGLSWYLAVLVATAIAPTDPAMVFSVLGRREITGRSGTILEGESGVNDPVGIALMATEIAAGGLTGGSIAQVAGQFLLQMAVGGVIGVAGGLALLWFARRVPLPSEGLYPLRTLACAILLYGTATLAYGSGFLAVLVAGIIVGGRRAPFRREVESFHGALASLGEIVAFAALGLTVSLDVIARSDVWIPGLIIGAALALVIRPVVAGLCLIPARLRLGERAFVLFAGLKGAVPILLGGSLLTAHVAHAERLYGIITVVVVFSVLAQGSLVPAVARALRVDMRTIEPAPWALGVRLQHEPSGVHELTVRSGSLADGRAVAELADVRGDAWISFIVRSGELIPLSDETVLQAGDRLLVLSDQPLDRLAAALEDSAPPGAGG